jgi:protein-S-isoprenylcysteine O-methyltransferase Ste14
MRLRLLLIALATAGWAALLLWYAAVGIILAVPWMVGIVWVIACGGPSVVIDDEEEPQAHRLRSFGGGS